MSNFEKNHEFPSGSRNALGRSNGLCSLIKLIYLVAFFTLVSGCIQTKGNIKVTLSNKKTAPLNISVANIQVINRQFIITGTNLSEVSSFQIKNGGSTTDLQIESKSNTSIVANTLSNVSFAVGTIFDFVLSNASAASTFQVTFTNSNNSITAPMLTSMSATKGQVMKYNGSAWVASSITNAQTYMGTWDALNNVPDLTVPSSMPGDYYIVSVAGPFNSVSYAVGDWIISDGYNWQKVANSAVVVSTFNGRRGIVTLVPGDYVSLKNGSGKVTGSSLNDLEDINIATPLNGSVLKYDTASSKWIVGVDNAGGGAYTGAFSKAVATDGAGALTTSTTTAAELNFVSGVTSSIQTQLGTKLTTALADGKLFVGNGSGVATAISLSGDATLINTGAITLKNTGTPGTYTSVTTDAQGRVTAGSNPAVAAITALTGDVTASGTGSVAATIATSAVTTGKILDGTILPTDLNFTGANIGTSGLVIKNVTGGFSPLVCSTVGYVPTWTVVGFDCLPVAGPALSSVTAALATNTIDNSTFAQVWNWSTATTQSLMSMAGNALTTGSILKLTTSNATVNSTNGLLNVANTGASTSGVLARFQANSTADSGMTMLTNGNVGIGTSTPAKALSVKGSIESTANVVAAGDVIATGYLAGSYMATSQISSIYSYSEGTPSTILIGDNEWTNTTGTQNSVRIDPWMHPSSGSATFTGLHISPVVEQTGGANGITRGLYIDAAIVAAADFRALEVTGGKSIFQGNVGIGTTSPSGALHVVGSDVSMPASSGTIQTGLIARLSPSGATTALDFGNSGNGSGQFWIQAVDSSNLADNQALRLNPNGGNVGVGTLLMPATALQVGSNGAPTAAQLYLASIPSTTAPVIVGNWNSSNLWAIGAETTGSNNTLKIGNGTGTFPVGWSGTQNLILSVPAVKVTSATVNSTFAGNVGIGATVPGYKLHVVGAGGATVGYFSDGTATCSITPATAGNISCSSDARLKKNIESFSDLRSLDNVLKLKTVTYEWKDIDNGRHTGFIAQEVEKIAPEFVINGKDGFKQVSYTGFIPWITGAIKAFYGEFKVIVSRVMSLEEKDAQKERAIASINANAAKLEGDHTTMKTKFETDNATLRKQLETLKKENELMKAKLDKIEKFIEKSK